MPIYTYKNVETGERWDEFRKIENMEDGCNETIKLCLSAPRFADPTISSKREEDFNAKVLDRIRRNVPGQQIDARSDNG